MKKLLLILCLAILGGVASAEVTTMTVTPEDLATKENFETSMFGWDYGDNNYVAPHPEGVTDEYYIGTGSFYGKVTGSADGTGVHYTALRINLAEVFDYNITLGDLVDISYSTNLISGVDWQVKIYTDYDNNGGNASGWYNSRIVYATGKGVANSDTDGDGSNWDTYSISSLKKTTSTKGDLEGSETIMFVDIILSYMTTSPSGESYLDNVKISDKYGNTYILDLEPSAVVPAPGAVFLAGLGSMLAGSIRRRMA